MTKPRIAVVGSVNLDLVVEADRLPRAGETVLGGDVVYRSGGKGANQAVAARRYGAEVALHACLGQDGFGQRLVDELAAEGLDLSSVSRVDTHPSGVALIVVDPSGNNTITVGAGANAAMTADALTLGDPSRQPADAVLVQLEVPLPAVAETVRRASGLGVPVMLNASPLPAEIGDEVREILADVDVLIVNETEARSLHARGDDWEQRARSLLTTGARLVVVTLGAEGAVAVSEEQTVVQRGFPVDVVDTTGAGDTFCGVLAVELARGTVLTAAMARACAAGAAATTRMGAREGMPTEAEVNAFLARQAESQEGL